MADKIRIMIGQHLGGFHELSPQRRTEYEIAQSQGMIVCFHCGVELTLAAWGMNVEHGGTFIRNPFVRAKHGHTPGFPCYEEKKGRTYEVISPEVKHERMKEAAERARRLALEMLKIEGDIADIKKDSKGVVKKYNGEFGFTDSVKRMNTIKFPTRLKSVEIGRPYYASGNFKVIFQEGDGELDNCYLQLIDDPVFSLKLSAALPVYHKFLDVVSSIAANEAEFLIGISFVISSIEGNEKKRTWVSSDSFEGSVIAWKEELEDEWIMLEVI